MPWAYLAANSPWTYFRSAWKPGDAQNVERSSDAMPDSGESMRDWIESIAPITMPAFPKLCSHATDEEGANVNRVETCEHQMNRASGAYSRVWTRGCSV